MNNNNFNGIKCCSCIHFVLCMAQKGGVNLQLASENDCCYYQSQTTKTMLDYCEQMSLELKFKERLEKEYKRAIEEFYDSFIDELMRGCGDDKDFWVVKLINGKLKKFIGE